MIKEGVAKAYLSKLLVAFGRFRNKKAIDVSGMSI
jgi:hypothetical protein